MVKRIVIEPGFSVGRHPRGKKFWRRVRGRARIFAQAATYKEE